jgi:hypothetical protein
MLAHNLILGSVVVSFDASYALSQTYEMLGGRSLLRMISGAGHLQTHWAKRRTVITGSGRLPAGLDGLDYTASMSLYCAAPLSIFSATPSATLPAARRTDWAPHGYAIVDGRQVPTGISIATNAVTFTAVSGASGYVVSYYPILTVYVEPPRLNFDGRGVVCGWEIVAEEV